MAKRTEVHYIDDISGEPAAETVLFGLDNRAYEIDLGEVNAKQLRAALAPYVEAGRRVTASKRAASLAPATVDREQRQAIRDWARANGHQIGDRGRVSAAILKAFNDAH